MNSNKIFLANDRGIAQTNEWRTLHTFNFGTYKETHKNPILNLKVCNDETIASKIKIKYTVEENTTIIVIPIVGQINVTESQVIEVQSGDVLIKQIKSGNTIIISNPTNELVNYIQIWIKNDEPVFEESNNIFRINVTQAFSKWQIITKYLSIAKLKGRQEINFTKTNSATFLFVINGAFEAAGCLLQNRDALLVYDYSFEIEALSNDAIIFALSI